MLRLLASRLALAVIVLFIVTFLTFFLVSLIPGSAAITILGQNATPQSVHQLNQALGLNQPLLSRYGHWLGNALDGNLGVSLYTGVPVGKLVSQRLPPTLFITAFATLVGAVLGVSIGVVAAVRGKGVARVLDGLSVLGISLPNFWIALLLALYVGGRLHWLPQLGYVPPNAGVGAWLEHLVLPVVALGVAGVAIIAKQTRDVMTEALSRDFMRFLQANGVSRRSLILRHGMRYGAVAITSAIVVTFINLFGGTVALEEVFAIPGIGLLVDTSAIQHDIITIQGAVVLYTLVILAVTIAADLVYWQLDPRLRRARS